MAGTARAPTQMPLTAIVYRSETLTDEDSNMETIRCVDTNSIMPRKMKDDKNKSTIPFSPGSDQSCFYTLSNCKRASANLK